MPHKRTVNGSFSRHETPWGCMKDVASQFHVYIRDYQGKILTGMPHGDATGASANRHKFGGKGETDPKAADFRHLSPWAYCAGDPVNHSDPTGEQPDEVEAAYMAQYVYSEKMTAQKALNELKARKWFVSNYNPGIDMEQGNGLYSVLFEREVDGVNEYAYVFRGTESIRDGIEDVLQFFGLSSQYESAVLNARALSNHLKFFELTFVGHSLGGGLAVVSSLATGRSAITFNAAGVSPFTSLSLGLGNRSYMITNYRTTGERIGNSSYFVGGCWLSNFQDKVGLRVPGRRVEMPLGLTNPIKSHEINKIVDYFKKNK